MSIAAAAFAVVAVFASSVWRWRCPNCRRFTGVKGRLVYAGNSWWRARSYRKYSCARCNRSWTASGRL